jgi:hypothetical protein
VEDYTKSSPKHLIFGRHCVRVILLIITNHIKRPPVLVEMGLVCSGLKEGKFVNGLPRR